MAPSVRTFIERLMSWYSADEQHARSNATATVAAHADEAMLRSTKAIDRANDMVESYKRAQENLCRH
jgi:hypothetical protein